MSLPQLVDRQGGFDIFGILDGALNYGIILRTIVMNIIAVKLHQKFSLENYIFFFSVKFFHCILGPPEFVTQQSSQQKKEKEL